MRMTIGAALAVALCASGAQAATYAVPRKAPVAIFDIPDSWTQNSNGDVVEITSPDQKLYLKVSVEHGESIGAAASAAVGELEAQGVQGDEKTAGSQDVTINGIKGRQVYFHGKDKVGPMQVSITGLVTKDPRRFVLITLWGDDKIEGENLAGVNTLMTSLKITN